MRRPYLFSIITMVIVCGVSFGGVEGVSFVDVRIGDDFWAGRIETNRTVTVPFDFKKCEETGRISNFAKAGGLVEGNFEGIYFNDSDLYKIIEGAAYSLKMHPDAKLEAYVDGVIDKIAAAQWEDGYLYTFYSLPKRQPEKRWTNVKDMHELYCAGHFFEGACAYYEATGKRKILDVAVRLADHIDSVFGEGKKVDVPGHEEIEIGLVRLYRVTDEERYLKLAKFFLDMRGETSKRKIYGAYCQDHLKVVDQREAVGHAVRAGYLYSGMADVAALTGDAGYVEAIKGLWENVVNKKLYLTGGIGARHAGEAFGDNYELPNGSAYNETCAAIANAMWNHRLFLLEGDAKYIDVLERVLYNGFLSGVSLGGNEFFYPNPLASKGGYQRQAWFGCSCCPSNVVRFVPSIANYVYAKDGTDVYVNLYMTSEAEIDRDGRVVKVRQETGYPWDGGVKIGVDPEKAGKFKLMLRVPGWARGDCVPGELYRYADEGTGTVGIKVNGKVVRYETVKGYAVISRKWKKGDVVEMDMPMGVRRVVCDERVKDNVGRVAIERGPIVYCLEGIDNQGGISNLVLDEGAKFEVVDKPNLFDGVRVIKAVARSLKIGEVDKIDSKKQEFTAVPYYAWAHRGAGEMAVWIAGTDSAAVPLKKPTIASTSK
ncbi:MAG: glycoside hydrolase family 127 protein, partial [Anaerohalosphaera sp.]|nr:glycoside hydrolase family 127 protein [Anaerohalosphaera sp.]